jgi:hypothetical protein
MGALANWSPYVDGNTKLAGDLVDVVARNSGGCAVKHIHGGHGGVVGAAMEDGGTPVVANMEWSKNPLICPNRGGGN